MRIGLDVTAAQRNRVTGWERYVRELLTALVGVAEEEDLTVVDLRKPRVADTPQQILFDQLRWYQKGLKRAAAHREIDVLHAPAFPPPRVPVPTVWTVHDDQVLGGHRDYERTGREVWARLGRRSLRNVNAIVTPTQAVADELSQYDVDATRLHVIRSGVVALPEEGERPRVVDMDSGLTVGVPEQFLLFVGSLTDRKRPDVAADAARILDLPLVLAGGLDAAYDLERIRRIDAKVLWARDVLDLGLAWLYDHAVALVAPSEYEGFDLPVAEALARGCPVACSALPVHREVAGRDAAFFPLGDGEGAAVAVTQVAARRGAKVPIHTWSDTAREYAKLYRQL